MDINCDCYSKGVRLRIVISNNSNSEEDNINNDNNKDDGHDGYDDSDHHYHHYHPLLRHLLSILLHQLYPHHHQG